MAGFEIKDADHDEQGLEFYPYRPPRLGLATCDKLVAPSAVSNFFPGRKF